MLWKIWKRPDHRKSWFWPLFGIGIISFLLPPGWFVVILLSAFYWYKAGRIPPSDGVENSNPFN